jgi:hypothetical protein
MGIGTFTTIKLFNGDILVTGEQRVGFDFVLLDDPYFLNVDENYVASDSRSDRSNWSYLPNAISLGTRLYGLYSSSGWIAVVDNLLGAYAAGSSLIGETDENTVVKSTLFKVHYPNNFADKLVIFFYARTDHEELLPISTPPFDEFFPPGVSISRVDPGRDWNIPYGIWVQLTIDLTYLRRNLSDDVFYSPAFSLGDDGQIAQGGFPLTFVCHEGIGFAGFTRFKHIHHVQIYFVQPKQEAPLVTTEVSFTRGQDEVPREVHRQTLMKYRPALVNSTGPGEGEAVQHSELSLTRSLRGNTFEIEGKPYDKVSLIFEMQSQRSFDPARPNIECYVSPVSGTDLPLSAQPHVASFIPKVYMDDLSREVKREGSFTAVMSFSPGDELPPGTYNLVFGASHERMNGTVEWNSHQSLRFHVTIRLVADDTF